MGRKESSISRSWRTQQPQSRPAPVSAQSSRRLEQPLLTQEATFRSLTRLHWQTITLLLVVIR